MDSTASAGLTANILLALLVVKELASASLRRKWRLFASYLNVAVVPLLITFLANVAVRFYELLQ